MPTLYYEKELYHYGVKGMKWGVRRYQDEKGRLTSAGRKRYSTNDGRDKPLEDNDDSDRKRNKNQNDKRGLTVKQKKAIKIGAAVAGTFLVAYGGYKLSQMYRGVGSKIDPTTGFRLIDKPESDDKLLQRINPGRIKFLNSFYKNKEIINGSSQNCMLCTTTYELRKRGFDVHAGYSTTGYFPDGLFPKIFSDYKGTTKIMPAETITLYGAFSPIKSALKAEGSGARGNIMVWWKEGGGHSMIWENVNGSIVFKDGQTGTVYNDFVDQIMRHADLNMPVEILRTDNLTLNVSEIKNYVNPDTLTKTYVDHGLEIVSSMAEEPVVQVVAATAGYIAVRRNSKKKAINAYKEEHPDTKLTDKEIDALLSKQRKGAKKT